MEYHVGRVVVVFRVLPRARKAFGQPMEQDIYAFALDVIVGLLAGEIAMCYFLADRKHTIFK